MGRLDAMWSRKTDPAAYGPGQVAFDLLFGVVVPVLCLEPVYGSVTVEVAGHAAFGLAMTALLLAVLLRPRRPWIGLPLVGVLFFGVLVALVTGILLLPDCLFGALIMGIGSLGLGLVPFLTALAFAHACTVLARRLGDAVSRHLLAVAVAATIPLAASAGAGLLASWAGDRWAAEALAAEAGSPAEQGAVRKLRLLDLVAPSCTEELRRTW